MQPQPGGLKVGDVEHEESVNTHPGLVDRANPWGGMSIHINLLVNQLLGSWGRCVLAPREPWH